MKDDEIRQALLEVEELKLKAQLRAVREAMKGGKEPQLDDDKKRMSQVVYVYQVLRVAKKPLHVSEIIVLCQEKFGIEISRESIVSALLKKVNRMDRFIKTDPNTFGLIEYRELYRSQKEEA